VLLSISSIQKANSQELILLQKQAQVADLTGWIVGSNQLYLVIELKNR
jgi:hypothetical protein